MTDFLLLPLLPVAILSGYGLLALLFAPFFRGRSWVLAFGALVGIVLAAIPTWLLWAQVYGGHPVESAGGVPIETAHGLVRVDAYGLFFTFILLVVGALSVASAPRFLEREEADHGEFYALILFALAGMIAMLQTTHLLMLLVGLEVFSLALYVLCGLTRYRLRSVESALKYFLLGAFSSGFLVYGLALLYGAAGTLDIAGIAERAAQGGSTLLWIGAGLVLVGLAFKIAVVPFHSWVPDVYQGAPTVVTGFMAAATKTAAFAALLRFLLGAFGDRTASWTPVLTWLAILTMVVGNLVALAQTDIKRLLAFSSISHAGYLLIAVVCRPDDAVEAVVFYLTAYAFMVVGAFAVAAAVGRGDARAERGYDLASWAGLGHRRPGLALAMTVFLLSLAGIPPTGGFLAKYLVFQAAIVSKQYTLAIVGALTAVIGAYYYLRVVVSMWMREAEEEAAAEASGLPALTATALAVSVVVLFYLGVAPGRVLELTGGLAASMMLAPL